MAERRIERVLEALAAQPDGPLAQRLCAAAAACLDAEGAGITLVSEDQALDTVCTTEGGRVGETLQSDLGEGPAHDAHRFGWPVLVDDLAQDDTWPAFGPAAVAAGVGSTFAFPLRRGSVRVGALTLYRRSTGRLSREHHADALVLARLALDLVLALQSDNPPGELDASFIDGAANTAGIHQASGMVSVQLGVDVGAALAVLRARAYTEERSLRSVAEDVVAHRLRLDDGPLDTAGRGS